MKKIFSLKNKSALGFIGFLGLVFLVSALGALVTSNSVSTWYPGLIKPPLNPPNWVFGPVWTTLYFFIAFSGWLVWNKVGFSKGKVALQFYFIQLGFNLGWSFLFFGQRWPLVAFIEISILWVLILVTLIKFYKISKPAGLLFVPYLAWVSFASYLNGAIAFLNPSS